MLQIFAADLFELALDHLVCDPVVKYLARLAGLHQKRFTENTLLVGMDDIGAILTDDKAVNCVRASEQTVAVLIAVILIIDFTQHRFEPL